jgi:hypothetical protein
LDEVNFHQVARSKGKLQTQLDPTTSGRQLASRRGQASAKSAIQGLKALDQAWSQSDLSEDEAASMAQRALREIRGVKP